LEEPKLQWDCRLWQLQPEAFVGSLGFFAGMSTPDQIKADRFLWHRRLGHQNFDNLTRTLRQCVGVKVDKSSPDPDKCTCLACVKGKLQRSPLSKEHLARSTKFLDVIHADIFGKVPGSKNRAYFVVFVDDFTKYCWVYTLRTKDDVAERLEDLIQSLPQPPKRVHTDRPGSFRGRFAAVCAKHSVEQTHSTPKRPELNGAAERHGRTITEMARTMLLDSTVDNAFWPFAVTCAAYLHNRRYSRRLGTTPFEKAHSSAPDISNLRVFGSTCYAYKKGAKFAVQGIECIMVGYAEDCSHGTYLLWNPKSKRLIRSRDVIFLEKSSQTVDAAKLLFKVHPASEDGDGTTSTTDSDPTEVDADPQDSVSTDSGSTEVDSLNNQPPVTRSKRVRFAPSSEDADLVCAVESALDAVDYDVSLGDTDFFNTPVPKGYKRAINSPHCVKWKTAMKKEWDALWTFGAFEWIPVQEVRSDFPGKKILPSNWVYALKPTKFKARMVVLGNLQSDEDITQETYAPTSSPVAIRILTAIAVEMGFTRCSCDFSNAFLNAKLEGDIFVYPPSGYSKPGFCLRLLRAQYGLRESPAAWHKELLRALKNFGLQPSRLDSTIFQNSDQSLYLCTYVDDLYMVGDKTQIQKLLDFLNSEYTITIDWEPTDFCGIEFKKFSDGSVLLNQPRYVQKVLTYFNMETVKAQATPMDPTQAWNLDSPEVPDFPWRRYIGCVLWLVQNTRPDLAYALKELSSQTARQDSVKAAKRLLCYVKGTPNLGLLYRPSDSTFLGGSTTTAPGTPSFFQRMVMRGKSLLSTFTDADWAPTRANRRSTSGRLIFFGNKLIEWSSKTQRCITLSTTEAEFVALSEAAKNIVYFRRLLEDLGFNQDPVQVLVDNTSALAVLKQPNIQTSKLRHVDVRTFYIKDLLSSGIIDPTFCRTQFMLGDIMTKPTVRATFEELREHFMGSNI
jgi:hypothetical protein